MNCEIILEKMLSKNSGLMWEGSSEILRCNDVSSLLLLQPHIPEIQASLQKIKMGGVVVSHRTIIQSALNYIEKRCQGQCRCSLYLEHPYISPNSEKDLNYIRIKESKVLQNIHEEHFWIICNGCGHEFKVVEIIGGHVPIYRWERLH